jgi:hypothetical protein
MCVLITELRCSPDNKVSMGNARRWGCRAWQSWYSRCRRAVTLLSVLRTTSSASVRAVWQLDCRYQVGISCIDRLISSHTCGSYALELTRRLLCSTLRSLAHTCGLCDSHCEHPASSFGQKQVQFWSETLRATLWTVQREWSLL